MVNVRVYLVLYQYVADNLGLNTALSLTACLSIHHYCIISYQTKEDRNKYINECYFVLRSREEYERDVAGLANMRGNQTNVRGIIRNCVLNNVGHWHVTEN